MGKPAIPRRGMFRAEQATGLSLGLMLFLASCSASAEPVIGEPSTIQTDAGQAEPQMIQAQQALTAKKYDLAITLFSQVMASGNPEQVQQAHEYYAVALELSGDKARAKQEYQNYLKRYPKTAGSYRVIQRLAALLSLELAPVELRDANSKKPASHSRVVNYGHFSQMYRYVRSQDDDDSSATASSVLDSNVDLNSRYRGERFETNFRINASYQKDLENKDNEDLVRFSHLSFSAKDKLGEQAFKLGRQRSSKGGVTGRYDGIELSKQLTDQTTLNVVSGFPVDYSSDDLANTERHFYSANLDIGRSNEPLNFNLFAIEQRFDQFVDRRALGGEFRFYKQHYNVFGLLDYDIYFSELNAAMINGYYLFPGGTSTNLSLSYRKSPYLTTRNALIGQQLDSIEELSDLYGTDDELKSLALDRTFDSRYASLNLSRPLNDTFDISGTVTAASLSGAPASGGVTEIESTGTELYFSSQLIGKGLLGGNDTSIFSVNYGNLASSSLYSTSAQLRYPVSAGWRLFPSIGVQLRDYDDGRTQTLIKPVFRTEYRYGKAHTFDFETGAYLYDTDTLAGGSEKLQLVFINLGYFYFY